MITVLICFAILGAYVAGCRRGYLLGLKAGAAEQESRQDTWREALVADQPVHEITGTWADPTEIFIADLDRKLDAIESERKDAEWSRLKQSMDLVTRRGQFNPVI